MGPNEQEEFEFRSRAEQEGGLAQPVDHTGIVNKSLSATMAPFNLPKVPVDPENKYAMSQMASGGQNPYQFPDAAKQAAQNGVDVDSGAPYGLRSLVSLGKTPDDALDAIKKYGLQGRIGPESKVPEFQNSKTGRWTTVDSLNPLHESVPTAGSLMDMTGETAGGFMGGGAASIPGIALGRMASEEGKYVIGGLLGVRKAEGPIDTGFLKDITYEGAKSGLNAAVGYGASNVGNVYKYARYGPTLFSKDIFKEKYWSTIQDSMKQNAKALDDYYSLAGNTNLKLDVAQLSNHPAAHAAVGDVRRGLQENDIDYAIRGQNNLSNLQQTFKDIADGIQGPDPVDPMSSGPKIVEWTAQKKAAAQAQKELSLAAAQDEAKRAIQQGLPQADPHAVVERVTAQLGLIKDTDKKILDKSYGDLAVMMGKPESVAYAQDSKWLMEPQETSVTHNPSMTLQVGLETLLKEAKGAYAVDSEIAGAKLRAIPDGFLKVSPLKSEAETGAEASTDADQALLREYGIEAAQKEADKKGVIIGQTRYSVDLKPKDAYWVTQAIKGLRSGVRADMRNSKGWLPPDAQDSARVADLISNDLKASLEKTNPEVLDKLEEAESNAKQFGARWRDSLLSEVANKKNGYQTPVVSHVVYQALFKTGAGQFDTRAFDELNSIARGSPQFQETIRQSILAAYRSQYTENGLPTRELHAKFLEDFAYPLQQTFSKAEMAQINTIGNLGDVVAKRSQELAKFDSLWNKSPYGKIPANSSQLSKAAFSQADKVRGIGTFLRANNPGLLAELQKDTAAQLQTKVLSYGGQGFNISALDKILAADTGKNLQDIMPPEYVQGLRTISQAAKMVTSTNASVLPADESLIHRVVRLFTGAFGKEARAYHLVRGFRERQANRLLGNLLADPDKMKQFVALKDQAPQVAAKTGLLTALGAYGFEKDKDGDF